MKLRDYFNFQGIMYGFFMIFFIVYVGKFGFTNLILESTNKWNMVFNIGAWFVLVSYCMDEFFSADRRAKKLRVNKNKENKEKKK